MRFCGCFYVRLPLLQKRPRLGLPVHSMVCLCAFGLALPVAISLFPQNSQVSTRTRLPPSARTFSPSPSLCLPRRRLWFKMVFIKLFIHMVTELQTYVLPTTSIPLPPLPSSSPLTLSLPLYTFPRVPDERSQKTPLLSPPTFSHPTGCLFQILPHTLTHSSPSVSEQNIASFGPGLDIYQCSLLHFSFLWWLKCQFWLWKMLEAGKTWHTFNSHLMKHFKHLNDLMIAVNGYLAVAKRSES